LAKRSGFTHDTVQRLEQGWLPKKALLATVRKPARGLGVPSREILRIDDLGIEKVEATAPSSNVTPATGRGRKKGT
jgi:hypothetical protein